MSTKKLLKLMIPFVLAMVMLAMLLTGCSSNSENKLITIEDPVEGAVYYIQDSKLNQYYQDHTTKEQAVNEFTDSITALRTYLDGESFVDTGYYMGVNYDIDLLDEQNNTAGNFQLRVDAYLYTYPYEDEDGNPIYKYYENGKYYDENNAEGTRTLVNALEIHNEAIKKSDISIEWYNGATNEVMIGLYFDGINSNSDDPGNILYVDIQGARRSFPDFGDTVLYQQMIRLLVHLSVEGLLSALGLQSDAGTTTINEYMIALVGENYKRTVNDDIVSLLFYAITLDVIKDQATNLLVKLFGTFEDKWDPLTYKYLGFRFSSVANATVQTILADMQSDISPDKEGATNVLTNAMFHLTGVVRDRANAPYHYTCDVSFDYGWVYPDKPLGAVNKDWYKLFDYGNYEFKGKLYVPSWDAQYDALIRTDMNPDDNTINNVFIEFRDIANGELAIGVYYKNERSYLDITGLQYMYGWIDLEYLGFPQVYDEHLDLAYVLRRFQILIGNVIVSIVDGILDPASSDKENQALQYIMDKTSMTEKIEFSTADEAAERERLLNSQAVSEIREAMKTQYDDNYIREYIEEYIYNAILLKKQESLFSANTETLLVDIELIKQMLEETGAGTFTTRQLINVVDSVLPYTLDQLAIMLGIPSAELMVEKTYFTFTLDVDTNLMTMIMYTNLGIEPGEPSNMMWKLELTPTHFGEAVPIADVNFDKFKPLQQIYTYSGTLKGDFVFSSQETVDLSKLLSATIGESSGLNTPYKLPNNTGLTFTLVYDQFVTDNYVNDDGETVEVGDPSGVWKRQGRSAFDLELKTKKTKDDDNGQVIIRLCSDDVSFNNDMYKQLNDPDPVKRSEAEHAMGYVWVSIECVYKYGQQAIPKVKIREDVFMASMSAYMNGQDKIEDDVSSFADNDFNLSLTSIISALCKDAYVVPEPEQMEITSSNDTLQSLFRVKGLIGNIKVDAGFTYRVKGLLSIKKSYYMYQVGSFKDIVGLNPYTTALHDTLNTHFYEDYRDEYEPLDYDFYVYPEDVLLDDGTMIEEGTIMIFELGAKKTLTRQPIRDKLAASSFYNNEPDENLDITEVYFALGDLEEIVTHDVLQNKYYYTTYYNKRVELDEQSYVKQDADNNIYIAWQGLRDIVFYDEGDTYYYYDLQMALAYEENDEENGHHIGDYVYLYKSEYRRLLFEYDPESVEVTASCKTQYAPRTNGSFMGETRRYFLRLTSIIPAELGALHSVYYDSTTKWPPQYYNEEDRMNVVEIYDDDGKLVDMYYDPIALFVMEPAEPLITSYVFNVCTDPSRTTDYLTWTPENETPHARTKWDLSEFATFTCRFIIDWSQVTLKGYFVVTEVVVGEGMMGETTFPCRIIVTNREVDTVEYASLFDKDNYRFNPVDSEVTAPGEAVPSDTYYVSDGDGYVITTDTTFREGVDYYVLEYYEANVPVVDSISIDPYEYLLAKYKYLSDTNNFSPSGYSTEELYLEAYKKAEEKFIIGYFEELFEKYPFNISFAWEVSELYRAEVEMDYIAQKYSNVSMDSTGSTVIDKYQWLFDAYLYGNNIEKLIKPAGGTVYIHTRFHGQLIAIRLDVGVRNFSYVKFNVYNDEGVLVREDSFSPEDFDDIQGKYSANYYDQSSYYINTDPIFVFTDENGKEVEHSFDLTYIRGLNENGSYLTDLYQLRWSYELITNVGTDGSYFMEYLYSPLYASDSETETIMPITSMYVYYEDEMASVDVPIKGGGTRKLYSKNETTGYAYILATSLYSDTKTEPMLTFSGEKISYDSLTQAMKDTEVRVYNEERREEDDGYLYINKGGYAYKRVSYEYTAGEDPVPVLAYGLLPMGSANYSLALTSLIVAYSDTGSGVALTEEQKAKKVTVDGVLKSLYADTDRNGYAEKLTPTVYDDIYFDPVLTNKGELVPYKSLSVEQKAQKVKTESGELAPLYRNVDGHAEVRRETQYKPVYASYTVFSYKAYSQFTSTFISYADLTEAQLAEGLYEERGGYAEKKIPIYSDTIVGAVPYLSASGEAVLYSSLTAEMKGKTVTRYDNENQPYQVALYSEGTDGYALMLDIGEREPFLTASGEVVYYDRLPGDLKNKTVVYYDSDGEEIEVNLYTRDANGYTTVLTVSRYSDAYETLVEYDFQRVDGYDENVLIYNEFTKESLFRLYNGKVQIRRADVYLPDTADDYCLVVSTKVIQEGRPVYVKYTLTGFSNKSELNRKVLVSEEKEEQTYWVSQGDDAAIRLGCWYSDNQWEDFVVDGKTFTSLNDISDTMRNKEVYVRKNDYDVDLFRINGDYYLENWVSYAGTVTEAMKEQKVNVLVEVPTGSSYDFVLNNTRYRFEQRYLYGEDEGGNALVRSKQSIVEIRKMSTIGTDRTEIILGGNPVAYSSLTAKEIRSRHFDESTLHYVVLCVGGLYKDEWEVFTIGGTAFENMNSFTSTFSGLQATLRPEGMEGDLYKSNPQGYVLVRDTSQEKKYLNEYLWVEYGIGSAALFTTDVQGNLYIRSNKKQSVNRPFYAYYAQFADGTEKMVYVGSGYRYEYEPLTDERGNYVFYNAYVRGDMKNEYITNQAGEKFYTYVPFSEIEEAEEGSGNVYYQAEDYNPADVSVGDDVRAFKRVEIALNSKSNNDTAVATVNFYSILRLYSRIDDKVVPISVVTGEIIDKDIPGAATGTEYPSITAKIVVECLKKDPLVLTTSVTDELLADQSSGESGSGNKIKFNPSDVKVGSDPICSGTNGYYKIDPLRPETATLPNTIVVRFEGNTEYSFSDLEWYAYYDESTGEGKTTNGVTDENDFSVVNENGVYKVKIDVNQEITTKIMTRIGNEISGYKYITVALVVLSKNPNNIDFYKDQLAADSRTAYPIEQHEVKTMMGNKTASTELYYSYYANTFENITLPSVAIVHFSDGHDDTYDLNWISTERDDSGSRKDYVFKPNTTVHLESDIREWRTVSFSTLEKMNKTAILSEFEGWIVDTVYKGIFYSENYRGRTFLGDILTFEEDGTQNYANLSSYSNFNSITLYRKVNLTIYLDVVVDNYSLESFSIPSVNEKEDDFFKNFYVRVKEEGYDRSGKQVVGEVEYVKVSELVQWMAENRTETDLYYKTTQKLIINNVETNIDVTGYVIVSTGLDSDAGVEPGMIGLFTKSQKNEYRLEKENNISPAEFIERIYSRVDITLRQHEFDYNLVYDVVEGYQYKSSNPSDKSTIRDIELSDIVVSLDAEYASNSTKSYFVFNRMAGNDCINVENGLVKVSDSNHTKETYISFSDLISMVIANNLKTDIRTWKVVAVDGRDISQDILDLDEEGEGILLKDYLALNSGMNFEYITLLNTKNQEVIFSAAEISYRKTYLDSHVSITHGDERNYLVINNKSIAINNLANIININDMIAYEQENTGNLVPMTDDHFNKNKYLIALGTGMGAYDIKTVIIFRNGFYYADEATTINIVAYDESGSANYASGYNLGENVLISKLDGVKEYDGGKYGKITNKTFSYGGANAEKLENWYVVSSNVPGVVKGTIITAIPAESIYRTGSTATGNIELSTVTKEGFYISRRFTIEFFPDEIDNETARFEFDSIVGGSSFYFGIEDGVVSINNIYEYNDENGLDSYFASPNHLPKSIVLIQNKDDEENERRITINNIAWTILEREWINNQYSQMKQATYKGTNNAPYVFAEAYVLGFRSTALDSMQGQIRLVVKIKITSAEIELLPWEESEIGLSTEIYYSGSRREFIAYVDAYNDISSSTLTEKGVMTLPTTFKAYTVDGILFTFQNVSYRFNNKSVSKIYYNINGIDIDRMTARGAELNGSGITDIRTLKLYADIGLNQSLSMTFYFYDKEVKMTEAVLTISDEAIRKKIYDLLVDEKADTQEEMLKNINIKRVKSNLETLMEEAQQLQSDIVYGNKLPSALALWNMNAVSNIEAALYSLIPTVPEWEFTSESGYDPSAVNYSKVRPWLQDDCHAYATYFIREAAVSLAPAYAQLIFDSRGGNQVTARNNIAKLVTQYAAAFASRAYDTMIQAYMERELTVLFKEKYMTTNVDVETLNDSIGYKNAVEGSFDAEQLLNNVVKLRHLTDKDNSLRSLLLYTKQFDLTYTTMYGYFSAGSGLTTESLYRALIIEQIYKAIFAADEQFGLRVGGKFQRNANADLIRIRQTVIELLFARMGLDINYRVFTPVVGGYSSGVYYLNENGIYVQGKSSDKEPQYASMAILSGNKFRIFEEAGTAYATGYFHLDENGFMTKGKGPAGITYYGMEEKRFVKQGTDYAVGYYYIDEIGSMVKGRGPAGTVYYSLEESVSGGFDGFTVEGGYQDGSYAMPVGITNVTMNGLLTVMTSYTIASSGETEKIVYTYVSKQVRSAINATVERWFDFAEGALLLEDSVENIPANDQRRANAIYMLGRLNELRSSIVRYSFTSIANYSFSVQTLRRGLINGVDFTTTLNNLLGKAIDNFLTGFYLEGKYVAAIRQARKLNMTTQEVYRLPTEENYLSHVTYYDIVRVTDATFNGGNNVYELSSESYFYKTSDTVFNSRKTYYTFVKREEDMRYIPVTVVTTAINLNELTVLARDTIGENYFSVENGVRLSATGGNFQQNVQYYYYGDAMKFNLPIETETVYRAEEDVQFGTNEYYKFVEVQFVDGEVAASGQDLTQNYATPYADREYDSRTHKYNYQNTTDTLFGMDEYRDYNGKEQYYHFYPTLYNPSSDAEYFDKVYYDKSGACSDVVTVPVEAKEGETDPQLKVNYCDCNVFATDITDESTGNAVSDAQKKLSTHTLTAQVREEILASYDELASYFASFVAQYPIQTTFIPYRSTIGSTRYLAYSSYYTTAKDIFDHSEDVRTHYLDYTIGSGAVLGVNKQIMMTFGTEDKTADDYNKILTCLSLLFGYNDKEEFLANANNIAEVLGAYAATGDPTANRMKFDGAIFTSSRSFVMPFTFYNGAYTVLSCFIVDSMGGMYVWINNIDDIYYTANFGNVLGMAEGARAETDVLGRCELFEVGAYFEKKTSGDAGDACYRYTTVYVVSSAENAKVRVGGTVLSDFGYHPREYDANSKTYTINDLKTVYEYYERRSDGLFYLTQDVRFTSDHKYYAKLLLRKEGDNVDYKEGENLSTWQARKNPFIEVDVKPSDWESNYTDYYIKVEGEYISNQDPEWKSGRKYFIRENYYYEAQQQEVVYRLVALYNTDTYYLYNEIPTVYEGRPSAYNVVFDEEIGGSTYRYSVAWPKNAINADIDYRGGNSDLSSSVSTDSTGITQYLEQKLVVKGHILDEEDLVVRDVLGEKALECFVIKHNDSNAELPQISGYDYQIVDNETTHLAVFRRKEDDRIYRITFSLFGDVASLATMDVYDSEGYLLYRFNNTFNNGKLIRQSMSVYNPFEFTLTDLPSIVKVGDETLSIDWRSVSILPTGNLTAESPVIYGNIVGSKGQQISMNLYVAAWNYAGLYQPTEQVTNLQYEVNGQRVYFSYLNPIYCYFSSYYTHSSVDYYLADISIKILTESGKVSTVSLPKLSKQGSEMYVNDVFTISGVDFGRLEFDSTNTSFLKKIFYPYIDRVIGGVDYSSRLLQYGTEDSTMQSVLVRRNYLLYWDINTLNGLLSDSRHAERTGNISLGNERIGFYTLSSLRDSDDRTTPVAVKYSFESMNISELQVMADNVIVNEIDNDGGEKTIFLEMPYYDAFFAFERNGSLVAVLCSNGHSFIKALPEVWDGSKYTIKCDDPSCSLKAHTLEYTPSSGKCVCTGTTCACSVINDVREGLIGKSGQIPLIMDIHSTYPETGSIILKENNVKYDMDELKVRLLWNVQENSQGFEEVIANLKMFVSEKYPDVDKSAQENYAINLFMNLPYMSANERESIIRLAMDYCKETKVSLKNASDAEVRREACKLLAIEQKYDFVSKPERLSGGGDAGVMVTVLVVADGNTNVYRQVLSVRVIFSDYTPLGYYSSKNGSTQLNDLRTTRDSIEEKDKSARINGTNGTYYVKADAELTGNIPQGRYFEIIGDNFVLTKDTEFKANKNYYYLWTNGLYIQIYGEYWIDDPDVPENSRDVYTDKGREKPYDNLEDDLFKLMDFVWKSRADASAEEFGIYEDNQNNIFARIRVGNIEWRYNEKTKTLVSESFDITVSGYTYTIKSSLLTIALR